MIYHTICGCVESGDTVPVKKFGHIFSLLQMSMLDFWLVLYNIILVEEKLKREKK